MLADELAEAVAEAMLAVGAVGSWPGRRTSGRANMHARAMAAFGQPQQAGMGDVPAAVQVFEIAVRKGKLVAAH